MNRIKDRKLALLDPMDLSGFCRVARVSKSHGYVLANIPKAGGNSVRAALIRTEEYLRGNAQSGFDYRGAMDSEYFYRFNTDWRFARTLVRGARRGSVVTVVRNPFTRILSAYQEKVVKTYRMLRGDPNVPTEKKGQRMRRLRETGLSPQREPSFEEFLDCVTARSPRWLDQHFAPQSRLLAAGRIRYDVIGRIEDYDHSMDRICGSAFGDRDIWRKAERTLGGPRNVNHEGGGGADRVQAEYTARAVDMVREYYRDDFVNFDYDTDPAQAGRSGGASIQSMEARAGGSLTLGVVSRELSARNLLRPGLRARRTGGIR